MTLPDIDALASYGGSLTNAFPVEDPTTDEDAAFRNMYATNVAAMTQTITRAYCAFVGNATTPTDPTSNVHRSVWGNTVGVKPTPARTSTGLYTVTWPTTVNDELLIAHTVNLGHAWVNVEGSTLFFANATVTAPNVVTVRVYNAAGSLNDAVGATICVFAI